MANTKQFSLTINGIEGAITNVNDLEHGIERLENAWKSTDDAFQRAQIAQELVKAKTKMEELEQSVEFLTSEKKLETIGKLGESLSGAFGIATVAAGAFGESLGFTKEEAEKYSKVADQVTAGLMSYRALMEGLTGENLKNLQSMLGMKQALLGNAAAQDATAVATGRATLASKLFGTTTRAAITATGIGALLVLLGLVIANWDRITAAVEKNRDTIVSALKYIAPPIYLVIKALDEIKGRFGGLGQFFSGIVSGISEGFVGLGSVLKQFFRGNFSGAAAEAKQLGATISKGFNDGVKEKQKEYDQEANDAAKRAQMDLRDTRIKVLESEGKDAYALKRRQLQDELSLVNGDGEDQKKERKRLNDDLLVLDAQHHKKVTDEAVKAAEKAKKEREKREAEELKAHQKHLVEMLGGEDAKPMEAVTPKVDATQAEKELKALGEIKVSPVVMPRVDTERAKDELDTFFGKANAYATAALEEGDSRGLLFNILFGPEGSDIEAEYGQALNDIVGLSEQIFANLQARRIEALESEASYIDEVLDEANAKLDTLNEQFADSEAKTQELEQKFLTAKGTERDLILKQLEDERKKRALVAAERKKEDERVKRAEADKLRVQQQITAEQEKQNKVRQVANALLAVQSAIEKTIMAIKSIQAIAAAGEGGKFGFDNVAYIIAATAAIAAAAISVSSIKFADGGYVPGPSHEQGGIQLWHRNGAHLGEMEGGEHITNKRATTRNASVLDQINRDGDRYSYVVTRKYADGGTLPDFGRLNQQVSAAAQPAQPDPALMQVMALVAKQQSQLDIIASQPVNVSVEEYEATKGRVTKYQEEALK
ncbi:hypothetical protein Q5H93_06235 [Hymenobacter sp. ASUV-10]|uniref:Phage tail tape measure protein n=1 Tax=Hymenobacter aranciens TaxID=3063996 RepID=A0ABT9B7S0_9BACT|nr:hypothetical protein [Hymenobacter sp. ASUV-10]MDO7874324.1 hypothetical protein [Hymenobacter sp. ASUV-10]